MGTDVPLDAWGLPIIPVDPPAIDDELGVTCDEDAGDWTPSKPDDMPLGRFLAILAYVAISSLRYVATKAGLQYGRNRWRI